jgi:triosephosphate isomerase
VRTPLLAANWKMNHGPAAAAGFMQRFLERYLERDDRTVAIFPPAVSVPAVVAAISGREDIRAGVQNIYWEDKGAFTGETSAPMARDAGATLALAGHSERRHVFGERDDETGRKCAAAARAGLTPVLCVGEKLEERERGETEAVVLRQLRAGLALLAAQVRAQVVVAYEPVWAIGTGRTARPEDASVVHAVIRRELHAQTDGRGGAVPILYGGSVNRENAAPLLSAPEIDGLLVGGASLDPDGWAAIACT